MTAKLFKTFPSSSASFLLKNKIKAFNLCSVLPRLGNEGVKIDPQLTISEDKLAIQARCSFRHYHLWLHGKYFTCNTVNYWSEQSQKVQNCNLNIKYTRAIKKITCKFSTLFSKYWTFNLHYSHIFHTLPEPLNKLS